LRVVEEKPPEQESSTLERQKKLFELEKAGQSYNKLGLVVA